MSVYNRLQQLICDQKIELEEGLQLLAAFQAAEARDAVVQDEIAHMRTARRSVGIGAILSFGLLGIALGIFIKSAVMDLGHLPAQPGNGPYVSAARDLDLSIAILEDKLRHPGSAADYRALGEEYARRYQQSHTEADRRRAAEALARAEQQERRTAMRGNASIFGIGFVLIIIAAVIGWVMLMYNGLGRGDEEVNARWAQVEAVLQRRLDLIPQLVETVKGYAAHERQTLIEVTEARARTQGILQATAGTAPRGGQAVKELGEATQTLSNAIGKLLALAEQYPDVKASTNFLALQEQLEGTENRISVERQRYNDAVRVYNAKLRVFPSNVIGGMFRYEPREYFESSAGAERAVPVQF